VKFRLDSCIYLLHAVMFALLHHMAGLGANKSTLDAEVDDIMGESKPGETQLGPAASFCQMHGQCMRESDSVLKKCICEASARVSTAHTLGRKVSFSCFPPCSLSSYSHNVSKWLHVRGRCMLLWTHCPDLMIYSALFASHRVFPAFTQLALQTDQLPTVPSP
jgi:hypothetical protein